MKKINIRDICSIGIFAAIIAACAQITVPMPIGVPMTLQTFAIPLAGAVLGKRNGTLSALVYILLGAVGVPVFNMFTGGMGIIFGVTGGFILSFPAVAFTAGIGAERRNRLWLPCWLLIGIVINFACGMLMFCAVHSNHAVTFVTYVMLPYIPLDILKAVLVIALSKLIKNALVKAQLFT